MTLTILPFLVAVWALLLTPGPTNILLAVSGMRSGFVSSLRLLPAELGAYLLVVTPLSLVGPELASVSPVLPRILKLAAALWVLHLAIRLWRDRAAQLSARQVSVRDVFVTTLLNPKGIIIGLVLLPASATGGLYAVYLASFAFSVVAVGSFWMASGASAGFGGRGGGTRVQQYVSRLAALWLGVVSVGLTAGAISG